MASRAVPLLLTVLVCSAARADVVVDGGLLVRRPSALPAGLSSGAFAGVGFGAGLLGWGVSASWSSATEMSPSWIVRHDDLRLRAQASVARELGRGTVALRAGVGLTSVIESRTRQQGERAGLEGDALHTRAVVWLPALELELVVRLRLVGDWGVTVGMGPSLELLDGTPRAGWAGLLGLAWRG